MNLDTIADPDAQDPARDTDSTRQETMLDDLELGQRVAEWLVRAG